MRPHATLIQSTLSIAALLLTATHANAQCAPDDAFEDNDVCGTAVVAPLGTTTGLMVFGAANAGGLDRDFWVIQDVPTGHELLVDVLFTHSNGNVDARLYGDATCSSIASVGSSSSDNENLSAINSSGASKDYYLMVLGSSQAFDCNAYDLQVSIIADQCLITPDDSFEPNDTCATAAAHPSTTSNGLFVSDSDPDFYTITVPANDRLTVDTLYGPLSSDARLFLYDDAACANQLVADYGFFGTGHISYSNATGAAVDVRLQVSMAPGAGCNTYDMTVGLAPDICLLGTDDSFEENDTCASATALAPGAHAGLFTSHLDDDHYKVTVAAGDLIAVDINYTVGNDVRLHLRLYDDTTCSNQLDSDYAFYGTGSVGWTNATGAAVDVVVEVDTGGIAGCNFYDLNVFSAPDPCFDPLSEDGFEENDDCSSAPLMSSGITTGLFVSKLDPDFYAITVPTGGTLDVGVLFANATADIDAFLYDQALNCGDQAGYVAAGQSISDDEYLTYTNLSGSPVTCYLEVVVFNSSFNGDCNFYDLDILGGAGSGPQAICLGDGSADAGGGLVGCPCGNNSAPGAGQGCTWSSGTGAVLSSSGTTFVTSDDLVFTCSNARPNQPSMLVQGATFTAFPFKDGILCVGNPTERIEVVILDAAGSGSTSSSIVTEGGVGPGDTRYYQQWFRDPGGISPCGTGSNFTGGLRVVWQ